MKKVLITGGAGFIGSNLALELLKRDYEVTVLDNLSPQIHGNNGQSSLYQSIRDKVRFIKGDVRQKSDCVSALKGQDKIIHLAAETGTGQSMYQVQKYVDVNCAGTANLLDILVNNDHHVDKFIIASSRAIYGEGQYHCDAHGEVFPNERLDNDLMNGEFEPKCPICHLPLTLMPTSESAKIHPSSVYGISKQFQEQIVLNVCNSIGIEATALRYQNVYGPGQSLKNPYTGILSIFSTQILNNNDINIFEDGKESRDFVYIDDVVHATILALEKQNIGGMSFNVGTGEGITVMEVAQRLKDYYSKDIQINVSGNYRLGDIRHNIADLTAIKDVLGYMPTVSFAEGVKKFASWVLTQEIAEDKYQQSITEMKEKGLFK